LVISFDGCLLQDSSFFFFLGIRKMDYGGASKQEEGEHACYTLILLQEWSFEEEGRETFQSMVSTVSGVLLGIAIGVSFKKFGIVSNVGLLFNQQHAADAQVQLQEQDACRYFTCPGAQPVGTELLPEVILAPLSDLFPHRLWGKPVEDLPHRPKYLLTLTVDLKQKDFVN
jgi:hypothetical protein